MHKGRRGERDEYIKVRGEVRAVAECLLGEGGRRHAEQSKKQKRIHVFLQNGVQTETLFC